MTNLKATRDAHLEKLIRPAVNAENPVCAVNSGDWHLVHVSRTTIDLHAAVDHARANVRDGDLYHRGIIGSVGAASHLAYGAFDQRARRFDFGAHFGEFELRVLEIENRRAANFALLRVVQSHDETELGLAQGTGCQLNPVDREIAREQPQRLAFGSDQITRGYSHIVEIDLADTAARKSEHFERSARNAWGFTRHENDAHALGAGGRIGLGYYIDNVG